MIFSTSNKAGLLAGLFITAVSVSSASVGHAQSANAGVSDTDYLSALSTMSTGMDLDGLASQTFDPISVVAPELSAMMAATGVTTCDALQLQAKESGRQIEIFGEGSALSDSELAALSKCKIPESGLLVSYLIPES